VCGPGLAGVVQRGVRPQPARQVHEVRGAAAAGRGGGHPAVEGRKDEGVWVGHHLLHLTRPATAAAAYLPHHTHLAPDPASTACSPPGLPSCICLTLPLPLPLLLLACMLSGCGPTTRPIRWACPSPAHCAAHPSPSTGARPRCHCIVPPQGQAAAAVAQQGEVGW
jgi:hypothetical protein